MDWRWMTAAEWPYRECKTVLCEHPNQTASHLEAESATLKKREEKRKEEGERRKRKERTEKQRQGQKQETKAHDRAKKEYKRIRQIKRQKGDNRPTRRNKKKTDNKKEHSHWNLASSVAHNEVREEKILL